jgi:TP901 family phage tail tape measure protein
MSSSQVDILLRSTADTTGFQQTEAAGARVANFMKGAFIGALVSAGYAAVRFAGESTEAFQTFDNSMREIFTLMPETSGVVRQAMSDDLRAVGKELGRLPEEMQSATYWFLSLGGDMSGAMDAVSLASGAARAGVGDLTDTMKVGQSVFNAYNHMGYELSDIYDQFFFMIRNGGLSMESLNAIMSGVTDISGELGVDLEDVSAALITMTKTGTDAEEAGQLLAIMLTQLGTSGTVLGQAFQDAASISFRQFIDEGGNLAQAMRILKEHSEDTGVALGDMLGASPFFRDTQAMRGVLQLTTVMMEEFEHQTMEAHDVLGLAAEAAAEFEGSMQLLDDQLQASKESAKTYLGEALEPMTAWWKSSQSGLYEQIEARARLHKMWSDGTITGAEYYAALTKLTYTRADGQDVMDDVLAALAEEERALKVNNRANQIYKDSIVELGGAYAVIPPSLRGIAESLRTSAQAQAEAEQAYAEMRLTAFEVTEGIESYDRALLNNNRAAREAAELQRELARLAREHEAAVSILTLGQKYLNQAQDDFSYGAADSAAWQEIHIEKLRLRKEAAEGAAEAEELVNAALLAQRQTYGHAIEAARHSIEVTEEGITTNYSWEESLLGKIGALGLEREAYEFALVALTDYDDQQIESILRQGAMREAIDTVVEGLRSGHIPSMEDAVNALRNFEDQLDEDYTLTFEYDDLKEVDNYAQRTMDRIREVAKTHHIHFDISQSGSMPNFPNIPQGAPIPMAEGGDFMVTRPTLFLAGEAGPERATFTPMGKGGGSGSGEGLTINGPLIHVEHVSDMATVDELAIQTAELLRSYRR